MVFFGVLAGGSSEPADPGDPRREVEDRLGPPTVYSVKNLMLNTVRVMVVITAIAVWQRVRMGVPVEAIVENPSLLWTSAARLVELGFNRG